MIRFNLLGEELRAVADQYADNGRLAIRIANEGGPFATLTCNLPDLELGEGEFFVKDWSENRELAKAALASGHFVDTGRRVRSHFVEVPVWRLADGHDLSGGEGLEMCVQLHEVVRIIYVVDGFEAALHAQDGARRVLTASGRTPEEALRNLDAACRRKGVYDELFPNGRRAT